MMEAQTVWRTWRRILREPPLQAAMQGEGLDRLLAASALGLSAEETEIVRAYAAAGRGTRWFIENYRFRMVSSFFNALETAAPLTHRALRASALELQSIATGFLDSAGWRDFGPFVYTYCGQILDHLLARPEVAALPGMSDLIRLERAGVRVVMGAADSRAAEPPPGMWRAAPWFEALRCELDLSRWLRDKAALGREPPAARPRWFVAYLRSPEEPLRIVAVPERAAAMLSALREPQTETSLASRLAGMGGAADAAQDRKLLEQLRALGLVRGPTAP